jgi:hypothetical protein
MTIHERPPFKLGETLKGKDADGNLINNAWLGVVCEFVVPNTANSVRGQKSPMTGRTIKAVAVRNESGGALQGKRLGKFKQSAGYAMLESIDGYARLENDKHIAIIDPFLPAAGVADDDIFWAVIEGPVLVTTALAGDAGNAIAVGDLLVAATAATSGAASAGRVQAFALANATDAAGAAALATGLIGTALSARTTANTGMDLLINACIRL